MMAQAYALTLPLQGKVNHTLMHVRQVNAQVTICENYSAQLASAKFNAMNSFKPSIDHCVYLLHYTQLKYRLALVVSSNNTTSV
jgi:hypothetical protein